MTLSVTHYGNLGDCIYSLPAAIDLAKGQKINYHLEIDHPAQYGASLKHPLGKVNLNRDYAEKFIPLLKAQPYIEDAAIWTNEPIDIDLNRFRKLKFDYGAGDIAKWYRLAFHCQPRTWEPWLHVEPSEKYRGRIVINRTSRYHQKGISYEFLNRWNSRLLFLGLPEEYAAWHSQHQINCAMVLPRNFLEAAQIIAASGLYIGNQSSCFAIAEGLKVRRLLEVCGGCPNVIPNGENGWEVLGQPFFESTVETLLTP